MFGETDIMKKNLTTEEMGKYLVLSLSFSGVSPEGDVMKNFRKNINTRCRISPKSITRQGSLTNSST